MDMTRSVPPPLLSFLRQNDAYVDSTHWLYASAVEVPTDSSSFLRRLPIRTAIHRNSISFHPIRKRSQSILLSTDKIHIHILDVTGTSGEISGSEFRLFYCDMDILHRAVVNPN
jgi:hypothetical protein